MRQHTRPSVFRQLSSWLRRCPLWYSPPERRISAEGGVLFTADEAYGLDDLIPYEDILDKREAA